MMLSFRDNSPGGFLHEKQQLKESTALSRRKECLSSNEHNLDKTLHKQGLEAVQKSFMMMRSLQRQHPPLSCQTYWTSHSSAGEVKWEGRGLGRWTVSNTTSSTEIQGHQSCSQPTNSLAPWTQHPQVSSQPSAEWKETLLGQPHRHPAGKQHPFFFFKKKKGLVCNLSRLRIFFTRLQNHISW